MNVLMQSRIDLFSRRGGDTIQVEKTAAELRRLGVTVDIDVSAEVDLTGYDLVHLFNIDWPAQVYREGKNAARQGKPIIFSPIHHSFAEIDRYEAEARFDFRRFINAVCRTRESREKLKDVCRAVADFRKILSTLTELRVGVRKEQQELLRLADLVVVQTEAEARDIATDFEFTGHPIGDDLTGSSAAKDSFRWVKVVNGVDPDFATADRGWFVERFGLADFVVCVGRIEPRKNQLAVIAAVARLREEIKDLRLVLIGKISWRHPEYAWRFRRELRRHAWLRHIEAIPYVRMGSGYAASRVHVLPSWFETTGLVNLEAALTGAGVVATGERAREYLGDRAAYCDPGSVDSIAAAIRRAWEQPSDPSFKSYILNNFTWPKVAAQTLVAYQLVLGGRG